MLRYGKKYEVGVAWLLAAGRLCANEEKKYVLKNIKNVLKITVECPNPNEKCQSRDSYRNLILLLKNLGLLII
jgi:hypothetical protein